MGSNDLGRSERYLRDPQRLYARLVVSDFPLATMKIQSDPYGDIGSQAEMSWPAS
jgi:hypothetical protein